MSRIWCTLFIACVILVCAPNFFSACVITSIGTVDPGSVNAISMNSSNIYASGSHSGTQALMSFSIPELTVDDICSGSVNVVNSHLLGTSFPFYGCSPLRKITQESGSCVITTNANAYYPQRIVQIKGILYSAAKDKILCKNNFIDDEVPVENPISGANAVGIATAPNEKIYISSFTSSETGSGLFIYDGLDLVYHYLISDDQVPLKYARDVAVAYPVAFVVTDDSFNSIQAIDVTDNKPPEFLGKLDGGGGTGCDRIILDAERCVAYVGCYSNFRAIDISDPQEMKQMCSISTSAVGDLAIEYPYAALAFGSYGLELVSINGTHAAVDLQFPDDGCTQVGDTPTLKWTAKTSQLDHYELYIGTTSNNLSLVASNIHNDPPNLVEYQVLLEPNTQYFWKVIADMQHCGYAESEIWSFTTSAIPSPPALSWPDLGAKEVNPEASLTLDWGDVSNATYDLYFGASNPPPYLINTSTASTHQILASELDACKIYFWKVIAKTSCAELSSNTNWFATGGTCPVTGTNLILSSSIGTTAGGTDLLIYSFNAIDDPPNVGFYDGADCSGDNVVWVDSSDLLEWNTTNRWIRILTPQYIETISSIMIDNSINNDVCQSNAFTFNTLAYTANTGAGNSSVVDTKNNKAFEDKGSMDIGAASAPFALAYNQYYPPGQALYALDAVTGDLFCRDAANFVPLDIDAGMAGVQDRLVLQDPQTSPASPAAFDLALALTGDGEQGFVTHVTAGLDDDPDNPTPGGLSWFTINWEADHAPVLQDVDEDAQTTSLGAPEGITRATLCVGDPPECEDEGLHFYPQSIKIVNLAANAGHIFAEGEPYPGEYAFVSGVGHKDVASDRSAMVAVLDLNLFLYCDPSLHHRNYCWQIDRFLCYLPGNYCNPNYWWTLQMTAGYANTKTLPAGSDGSALGSAKLAMDFAADSSLGQEYLGPTLYLANQHENAAYLFHYDDVNWDWVPVMDGSAQATLATGAAPSGVKVQFVDPFTYAYIANADDDTVYAIDTASNSIAGYMDQTDCGEITHTPMSFDSRIASDAGGGNWGYSADMQSSTVSVFDLPNMQMGQIPDPCVISLPSGSSPADIVVQPVPEEEELFGQMMGMLVAASPADYDAAADQEELIGDWKAVRQLVLTPASPTAILAALEAYLNKIDQKMCREKLKGHMKQAAKLYRAIYRHHHPGN